MSLSDFFPEVLHPADNRFTPQPVPTTDVCDAPVVAFTMNQFWASHVIGQIERLTRYDAWIGTDDEVAGAVASVFKIMNYEVINMGCGCGGDIPLQRIDENGHYQQSTDGGATWHDAPNADPRNSIPRVPPSPPTSTSNAKCLYADSIVEHFKTKVTDVISEGSTVETMLGFLTSAAELLFGPLTGPIGWIIPALVAIPTAILAFGLVDFKAALTDTVWNKFRCLIYCHMEDDGTITQSDMDAIYSGIDGVSPDNIVRVVFRSWFAAIGTTGMTNAAHLGMGETGADCSGCDCECAVTAHWGAGLGTIERVDNCTWRLTAIAEGDHYAAYVWFDNDTPTFDATKGGICTDHHAVSGSIASVGYNESPSGTLHFPTGGIIGICASQLIFNDANPFVVEVTVGAC